MIPAKVLFRGLAGLLALAATLYVGDYALLRIRMLHPTANWPVESVTRPRVLAILLKNGRYDYQIDQLQPVETLNCVHALFPHLDSQPCWYLKPRVNQPIVVN